MKVALREIDRSSWEACCRLKVLAKQEKFVASNAFSLAEAAYEPDAHSLGIFADEKLVGYIMWIFDSDIPGFEIRRFMVDAEYQRKGIGRAAMAKLLDMLTARLGHVKLYISSDPENVVAIGLYESFGFAKNGMMFYDEVALEKQL